MKINSTKNDERFPFATFGLLLLLLASCPHRAAAQTNTFPGSGNTGIGTTSPANPLQVTNSGGTSAGVRVDAVAATSGNGGALVLNTPSGSNHLMFETSGVQKWVQYVSGNDLRFWASGGSDRLTIQSNGNVGIGTSAPTAKLQVISADDSVAPALSIRQDNAPLYGFDFLLDDDVNGNLFVKRVNNGVSVNALTFDRAGGNVGIGTASPGNKLEVVEANSPLGSSIRVLSGSASSYAGYAVGRTQTEGYWGVASAADHYAIGTNAGDIVIRSESNLILANSTSSNLYLKANGNIGIGTTNPLKRLDVVGDVNASGTITGGTIVAKYQDVAEWVPASRALPAGTVVTLDPTKSNHVEASSHAYDTRVAGVVSAQPGITLGEQSDSKVLVATTGRVKVIVDASSGPIQVGDLLVTSDIAGVAKKSEPLLLGGVPIHRPGTLIGKALEPLAKGKGEILVLLSLQ